MSSVMYECLIVAKSAKAELQILNGMLCIVNGEKLFAEDDLDLFCKRLTAYWPLLGCEAYRWMVRRLSGYPVCYSNSCDGLLPAKTGKPTNMFGVTKVEDYAPCDDVDNLLDVVAVIRQVYGVALVTK